MVALNFDARTVDPSVALEAVPSDTYNVMITGSAEKPTKTGNGTFVELEMTIQGGQFAGRKVFDRLNLKNPNQQAVDIAYRTLSAICNVTQRYQIQDTQQLHGVPFKAVVLKVERKDDHGQATGQFSNDIKGYKDINGNDPGQAGSVATPAAQPSWAGQQQAQLQPAPQQFAQPAPQQQQPPAYQQPPVQPAAASATPVQQPAPQYAPPAQPAQGAVPPWATQQTQQPPQQSAPQVQPAPAAGAAPPWAQQQ